MDSTDIEEYISKYASKAVAPRKSAGDTLLAAMENLQPVNAVTTGTFSKMYNKSSKSGPQPIFQAVQNNWNLPLVFTNFWIKTGSVLNISAVQKSYGATTANDEQDDANSRAYASVTLFEKFNKRKDDDVTIPKTIQKQEYQRDMSLKEFCDRYNATVKKGKTVEEDTLNLQKRIYQTTFDEDKIGQKFYPLRLVPHMEERNANPKSPKYWLYCKHLCLWIIPCAKMNDLLAPVESKTEDEQKAYWKTEWEKFMLNELAKEKKDPSSYEHVLPKWVRGTTKNIQKKRSLMRKKKWNWTWMTWIS